MWLMSTILDSAALGDPIYALFQSSAILKWLQIYISNPVFFLVQD